MSSRAPILVVSGLPGVGKSTTARGLAERFERAAHVEADRLHQLIVSGAVRPTADGASAEAQRQLDLRLANACLLGKSFADAGFVAIIDDIVMGRGLTLLQQHLAGVDFEFVMLLPDFDHVKQRWIDMASPFADKWDWIDHEIRHNTERVGLWLDTTELDADETVDAIMQQLGPTAELR